MKALSVGNLVTDKYLEESGVIIDIDTRKYTQHKYKILFGSRVYYRKRIEIIKNISL